MKTLIVYYSLSSNNEMLARELQRRLGCDIFRIEEPRRRTKFTILFDRVFNRTPRICPYVLQMEKYTDYIFVSPVWASGIATPLKTFINREKDYINNFSFITVCGGVDGQEQKLTNELTALIHQEPEKVTQLCITDLIPAERKNDVDFISKFRIDEETLRGFENQINDFISAYELMHHE